MEEREIFELLTRSFQTGIRSAKCKVGRQWVSTRKLDIVKTGIGFNSGQIHHRKEDEFKRDLKSVGYLKSLPALSRKGNPTYEVINPKSVVFPLKDKQGEIVNYHFEKLSGSQKVYLNQKGVYPEYPHPKTQVLFIAKNILSAATILSAGILENREAVIALKDDMTSKNIEAVILDLKHLKEIILIN